MKALIRLKTQARLHEQREEWEKAAQLYLQVLEAGEDAAEEQDLSLYNRVGDLYLRLRRPREAVQYFEQAADRYASAGLYNNAIALCNKALRQVPEQLELYRKLGQYYAQQGFLPEARRWYLDYTEWRLKAGEVEAALAALAQFAEVTNNAEVRELFGRKLAELGRKDSAVEELGRAYRLRVAAGEDAAAEAVRAEVERIDVAAAARLEAVSAAPPPEESAAPVAPVDADFGGIELESAADAAGLAAGEPTEQTVPVDDSLGVEPIPLHFESNLEELRQEGALEPAAPETVDAAPLADLQALPSDLGLGDDFVEIEPIPLLDVQREDVGGEVGPEDAPAPLAGLDFGTLDGGPEEAAEEETADASLLFAEVPPLDEDPDDSDDEDAGWTELPLLEGREAAGGGLEFAPEESDLADEPSEDAPVELPLLDIPGFDPVPGPAPAARAEPEAEIPDLPFLEAPGLADLTPLSEGGTLEPPPALPDLEGTLSYARMLERRGDLESAIATLRDLQADLTAAGRLDEAAMAAAELSRLRPGAAD